MKKLDKKDIENIKERLKPFWKKHEKLELDFRKLEEKLEKKMNAALKAGTKLSFFYVEGECVGIGADDYSARKNFPLIKDTDLE